MGDRWIIDLNCDACEGENEVYYAPSCGFETFKCMHCGRENEIVLEATAVLLPMKDESADGAGNKG